MQEGRSGVINVAVKVY